MTVTDDERRAAIAGASVWHDLAPAAIEAVADRAQVRALAAEEELFAQGEDAAKGYLLISGRIRLDQISEQGGNVVLHVLKAGDLCGTVAVLMGIPYPATATAIEDVVLLEWTRRTLDELGRIHPFFAAGITRFAGTRIVDLHQRVRELSSQRVEQRLAATLLRLLGNADDGSTSTKDLALPFSRQDLAEMNGTTLHSISRAFGALESEGVLTARRKRSVTIHRMDRLIAIADGQ